MVGGLGHGAKDAALELLDVVFDWIVPVITLIVGYVVGPAIGLSGALGTIIDGALGAAGVSAAVMAYVADFVAILIWAAIGSAMWSLQNKGGKYGKYILRPLSTLFFGFALGEVPALVAGKVNNGSIGTAVNKVAA